jgi:CheY-like chemotaxis protein
VPGRGSVFRIRVPLGEQAAVVQPSAPAFGGSDALGGRCVVVIDDEAAIRDGMRDLLAKWGCQPIVASSPAEAVDSAARAELVPALIVADYRLRGGSTGTDAVAALRARFGSSLPALLITGDTAPERLREAAESGLHVLHKPVRPAQLRALCNHLLTAAAGHHSVS